MRIGVDTIFSYLLVAEFHHGWDGRHRHAFAGLIIHVYSEFDNAFANVLGIALFLLDFILHGEANADVTRVDGLCKSSLFTL